MTSYPIKISNRKAFTLIEVTVVGSILAMVMLGAAIFIAQQQKFADAGQHKKFAYQKAVQILNELKTLQEVEDPENPDSLDYLDDYADGTAGSNNFLTIQDNIINADDPISGNIFTGTDRQINNHWQYSRRILVEKDTNSNAKDFRKVGVKIFLTDTNQTDAILLTELWTVIQTAADPLFPPTQVYDLYAIALENVPGWWVYMNNLVPQVENAILDIQGRNPGLKLRVHWITKMGYGRDKFYQPVFNTDKTNTAVNNSATTAFSSPYFYPAVMPEDLVGDTYGTTEYYVPDMVEAMYRTEADVTINGVIEVDNFDNPTKFPYTIADSYNQSARHKEQLVNYESIVAAGISEEMPYTLLLDDFYENPDKYRNALFINLHGELLPVPSTRNYSDAAKHVSVDEIINLEDTINAVPTFSLNRVIAQTRYACTIKDSLIGDSTVVVSQLQNIAHTDDIEAGDWLRIGNEGIEVASVDASTRQITFVTPLTANHSALSPVNFYTFITTAVAVGDGNIRINSIKGLQTSLATNNLSLLLSTGPIDMNALLGSPITLDAVTPSLVLTSNITGAKKATVNSAIQIQVTSAIPLLATDLLAADAAMTFHGNSTNFSSGDYVKIDNEVILLGNPITSISRAQMGSIASDHALNTPLQHVYLADSARIVTHPENIRYDDGDDIALRTYAYLSDSQRENQQPLRLATMPISLLIKYASITYDPADPVMNDWISIRDSVVDWVRTNTSIDRIEGGVFKAGERYGTLGSEINTLTYANSPQSDSLTAEDSEMYAEIDPVFIRTSDDSVTPVVGTLSILIRLYNTPLVCPQDTNNRGLNAGDLLYDMEYRPYPVGNDFSDDLTITGNGNKNTARWISTLPALNTVLGFSDGSVDADIIRENFHPLSIETRMGDMELIDTSYSGDTGQEIVIGSNFGQLNTLSKISSPHYWDNRSINLSTTYAWAHDTSTSTYESDTGLPFSEKYQFTGDPMHSPYLDVKLNHGYNWFFKDNGFTAGEGFDHHYTGWGDDSVEVDVPRMMQFLRKAMMKSNSIWTTISGYSYYYIGTGNEIGYDGANNFPGSVPVNEKPYGGDAANSGHAQHIINGSVGSNKQGGYGFNYIVGGTGENWLSKYWLGELYRDEDAFENSDWMTTGGVSTDTYHRVDKNNHATVPSDLSYYSGRRSSRKGCKSFYNLSNDGGNQTFDHEFSSSKAYAPTAITDDIKEAFNLILPTEVDANRPWTIKATRSKAQEWSIAPYSTTDKTNGSVVEIMYSFDGDSDGIGDSDLDTSNPIASGILQVYDPNNTEDLGYFAIHGISQTTEIGSAFIGRYAIISLVYTFLRSGADDIPVNMARIEQLPLIEITAPTDMTQLKDPGIVSLQWKLKKERWDNRPYTAIQTYDDVLTTAPTDGGFFKVGYSDDNRQTWKYITTNTAYTEGLSEDATAEEFSATAFSSVNSDGDTWKYAVPWDLSAFVKGSYFIRIEYHRKNPITGVYRKTHYSHHMMTITVEDE